MVRSGNPVQSQAGVLAGRLRRRCGLQWPGANRAPHRLDGREDEQQGEQHADTPKHRFLRYPRTAARPRAPDSALEALKASRFLEPLAPVAVTQVGRGQRVSPRAVYQVGQAQNLAELAVEHAVLALPIDATGAVSDRGHA